MLLISILDHALGQLVTSTLRTLSCVAHALNFLKCTLVWAIYTAISIVYLLIHAYSLL